MKKTYILPLFALCLAACVDDEGNYNYTDLNEISIDNLEESYSVLSQIDRLQINPDVTNTFGEDLDNFSFQWHICSGGLSTNEGYHKHTIIGEEKDLDWPVSLNAGSYTLYYTITDNASGIETQAQITLRVSHPYTRGFLVLGELPDKNSIALDMLSVTPSNDTIMMEDVFDNSQLNLKKPRKIVYSGSYGNGEPPKQTMWLMADDNSYRLSTASSFDVEGEFNQLDIFDTDYPVARPAKMLDMFPHQTTRNMNAANRGYITEDMVLFANIIQDEYYVFPINRYSTASTALFKPSPYVFYNSTNSYTLIVLYDDDAQQFVINPSYTTNCSALADKAGDVWSWQVGNEGRKLIFGENLLNTNMSYAITKDNDNNHFIYSFKTPSSAAAMAYKLLYPVDMGVATDFDKASYYMFAANRSSIFYTVGSRLYQYDYTRGYVSYHDFGDEITYIDRDYCSNGNIAQYFVATYSDGNKGKIYRMNSSSNADAVDFTILQEWSTRLKVKDVEYKYGT